MTTDFFLGIMRVSLTRRTRTLTLESWMSVTSWPIEPLGLAEAHRLAWNCVCSGRVIRGPTFSPTVGENKIFLLHMVGTASALLALQFLRANVV